jgi:hypothetical protein
MEIRSGFRFWAILVALTVVLVTAILFFIIWFPFTSPVKEWAGLALIFPLMIFTWTWLVFGELRHKVVKVCIKKDCIEVRNYFGLGHLKSYQFSEIDGSEICFLPTNYSTYEFLYLLKEGKKLVQLSEFYHSNYAELKAALQLKVEDKGEIEFSLMVEIREIFDYS